MLPRALSVSELNHQARHLLESSFMQVWVEGELSGFSRPSSGHWYFSLKDARCQVRCAMFRGFNQRVRALPREGDQVRIRGKVTLYENRGDFQIVVEHLEPAGEGALQQAFEALKQRLQAEGLFDPAHKRPLPTLPRHIGVVTSPTGAAIHDILTVLARRCPGIPVTLYPTAVQGKAATQEIVDAIGLAQAHGVADVLIIGRGGGSLEDLWCFNEEAVARAIATCTIPTVSAVGHEVDVTIADFVADLRAPTPSAAAEKVSPDVRHWLNQLDAQGARLARSMAASVQRSRVRMEHLRARLKDPRRNLQETAQRLDDLDLRLNRALAARMGQARTRAEHLSARLATQSPGRILPARREQVATALQRLERSTRQHLRRQHERWNHLAQSLHLVSPLATLGRGYAIVRGPSGQIVRDAASLAPGDTITARVAHGDIEATVAGVTPTEAATGKAGD
ncbi:exodeoxyribonuclease VII large subunit [Marinobacter sp. C2H3]|uniref:exodeoxyribonuclease VII large subunit n=1 Tax=Marinobacter sp. C2H3 TaxID=3119003 RepID=UPI00300EA9E7